MSGLSSPRVEPDRLRGSCPMATQCTHFWRCVSAQKPTPSNEPNGRHDARAPHNACPYPPPCNACPCSLLPMLGTADAAVRPCHLPSCCHHHQATWMESCSQPCARGRLSHQCPRSWVAFLSSASRPGSGGCSRIRMSAARSSNSERQTVRVLEMSPTSHGESSPASGTAPTRSLSGGAQKSSLQVVAGVLLLAQGQAAVNP